MHAKLDHLRTFKVVAETGSLSNAAKSLNRTPSAISMSLKQFTDQLGKELFESDRKSTLTPLGQYVLERSRSVLKAFDESMTMIQRYADGDEGTVRIASIPSFATQILPAVMQQFVANCPNVRVELRELDSEMIAQSVLNEDVDIGVASRLGLQPKLQAELIFTEPFGLVCRSDNSFVSSHKSIHLAQLINEPFISNDLFELIDDPHARQLKRQARLHIHNTASLLSFVKQGFGLTLLPLSALPKDSDLKFVALAEKNAIRELFIIQRQQHRLNPAARSLKQLIKATIDGQNVSTAIND